MDEKEKQVAVIGMLVKIHWHWVKEMDRLDSRIRYQMGVVDGAKSAYKEDEWDGSCGLGPHDDPVHRAESDLEKLRVDLRDATNNAAYWQEATDYAAEKLGVTYIKTETGWKLEDKV